MADIIAINQTAAEQLIDSAKAAGKVVVFRKIRHTPKTRAETLPKNGGYWPDGDGPRVA